MEPARPLRDVFADLVTDEDARRAHAADPEGFLQAQGHPGLSGQLVSEAIVNYADTAPTDVAEHLAPFVMAHSLVPVDDAAAGAAGADGLQLLATAPAEAYLNELPDDSPADGPAGGLDGELDEDAADGLAGDPAAIVADPFDLDFGHGDQVEDMQQVPHPGGGPADPPYAADPGHGHEAQLDAAFTELAGGPAGPDDLVAEVAGAPSWLASDQDAVDSGHRVTDLEQDLETHRDVLDASHNLADLQHDLDAHRTTLDTGHDRPDEQIADS